MAQHMEALGLANKARMMRRKIRDDIRDDVVTIQDLLYDPPEVMLNGRVSYFLMSKRWYAKARTENILRQVGCTHLTKVGNLTERQRDRLIEIINNSGKPLLHSPCPDCGGSKYYTSERCVRCSNKKRRRPPWPTRNSA